MPGVSRVGLDSAGGTIVGVLAPTVYVNGANIVCLGAAVTPHPPVPPHSTSPVMAQASSTVYANGIPICRQGDAASCGHAATGSGDVFAN